MTRSLNVLNLLGLEATPAAMISKMVSSLEQSCGKTYPWALSRIVLRLRPGQKEEELYRAGRPIISFVDSPFWPVLNSLARMIFQRIPVGCPNHFVVGDVYALLKLLKEAPRYDDRRIFNQDLAGFFMSIEPDRLLGSSLISSDLPRMNVNGNDVFSVYLGKTTKPGGLVKGRTFRRLNVTRKIAVRDVPALNMQTFALGPRSFHQRRGSPMGSPLPPALSGTMPHGSVY